MRSFPKCWAWLLALLPVVAAADQPAERDAEDQYQTLLREYAEAAKSGTNPVFNLALQKFPARFVTIARRARGKPVAYKALDWVIRHADGGSDAEDAAEILARDHAREAAVGSLCFDRAPHLRSVKGMETLCRNVIEQNPDREARALAAMGLARYLAVLAEFGDTMRLNPRTDGFLDWSLIKRLKGTDPEGMRREAEVLFDEVCTRYAELAYGGIQLGEKARDERAALREAAVGTIAPEIVGEDLDGRFMKLSDYRGKVIVLNFTNHEHCGPCRAMYLGERRLVERMKDRPFALLGVNSDDNRPLVLQARDAGEITWRSWWDGGRLNGPIMTRWHIVGWPTVFILDQKGVIRYKHLFDADQIERAVALLLEEGDSNATTKPSTAAGAPHAVPVPTGFDQIIQAVEAVPSPSLGRSLALCAVGEARVKLEGKAAAEPIFRRAVQEARAAVDAAKGESNQATRSVFLALIQFTSGDRVSAEQTLRQATQTVSSTDHASGRNACLSFIARTQSDIGDVRGCRAIAEDAGTDRTDLLAYLAVGQAKAGDPSGALATLKSVEDAGTAWADAMALPEVALAQIKSGDSNGARRTIDRAFASIEHVFKAVHAQTLARLAVALAKVGDQETSRATIKRALRAADEDSDFSAAEALAQIARAQQESGDVMGARASLRMAAERNSRLHHVVPQVNDLIAEAYLELGDVGGALETARAARDEQGRLTMGPEVVRRVAREQIRSGDVKHALDWLPGSTDSTTRAYALLGALEGSRSSQQE
jgi:tetratricopeptide (TPR) repeat protein